MPAYIGITGAWRELGKLPTGFAGAWRENHKSYIGFAGAWRECYAGIWWEFTRLTEGASSVAMGEILANNQVYLKSTAFYQSSYGTGTRIARSTFSVYGLSIGDSISATFTYTVYEEGDENRLYSRVFYDLENTQGGMIWTTQTSKIGTFTFEGTVTERCAFSLTTEAWIRAFSTGTSAEAILTSFYVNGQQIIFS